MSDTTKPDRYFQVDANIEVRFAVSAKNEDDAKSKAYKRIKSLFELGIIGASGWDFKPTQVRELKPI